MTAIERIGMQIMSEHPNAYRPGQWGTVIGIQYARPQFRPDGEQRWCYIISWPDGALDLWSVADDVADYQWRMVAVDGVEPSRQGL